MIKTPSLAASGTPQVSKSLPSTTLRSLLCKQLASSSAAPDHGMRPSHLPIRPHQTRTAPQVRLNRGLDTLAGTTRDRRVCCIHKTFHLPLGIWEPQLSCKHCTPPPQPHRRFNVHRGFSCLLKKLRQIKGAPKLIFSL